MIYSISKYSDSVMLLVRQTRRSFINSQFRYLRFLSVHLARSRPPPDAGERYAVRGNLRGYRLHISRGIIMKVPFTRSAREKFHQSV